MAKRKVPVRVDEYVKKHPEAYNLLLMEVHEIAELGSMIDIVTTAYAYGYMKGARTKKGRHEKKVS